MTPLPARVAEVLETVPEIAWRAPGRANLMGDHTDYNDGLVLPVALELSTYVAGDRAPLVHLVSLDVDGEVEVDPRSGDGPKRGWGAYVTGVVRALLEDGLEVQGLDGVVASDVPVGAGLSSSAALEVAVARALCAHDIDPQRLARICQRAENDHVGVRCGIMDQMASAAARAGHALLIDCADLSVEHVPVPRDLAVLVIDSGSERSLTGSGYNRRRAECERAARALGVPSLRHATLDDVDRASLDGVLAARARHVVTENQRVRATAEALRSGDRGALADLFARSHRSLSEDFDVSTPEIDTLVKLAGTTEGIVAARLTGAGFGGCVVALVEAPAARAAGASLAQRYRDERGIEARWWVSAPAGGAELVGA